MKRNFDINKAKVNRKVFRRIVAAIALLSAIACISIANAKPYKFLRDSSLWFVEEWKFDNSPGAGYHTEMFASSLSANDLRPLMSEELGYDAGNDYNAKLGYYWEIPGSDEYIIVRDADAQRHIVSLGDSTAFPEIPTWAKSIVWVCYPNPSTATKLRKKGFAFFWKGLRAERSCL